MTENEAMDPYNNDPDKWTVRHERNKWHQGDTDAQREAKGETERRSSRAPGNVKFPTCCSVLIALPLLVGVVAVVSMLLNRSPAKPVVVAQQIPAKGHHAEKMRLRPPMATRLELQSDQPVDVVVLTESGYQSFNVGGLGVVNPKDVHFRTPRPQTKLTQLIVTEEKQGLHSWVVVLNPGTNVASIQMASKAVAND